jgi:Na+/H+-dicarboxylate symporter
MEAHSVTRVLVALALALIAVGLLAFSGLATVTGSWLVLAGSLLALSGLGNELFHRR